MHILIHRTTSTISTLGRSGSHEDLEDAVCCFVSNCSIMKRVHRLGAGLYELAQYAFLADRNGGSGLTWSKLHDDNNGMITIWIILIVEWAVFLVEAWYLDQARLWLHVAAVYMHQHLPKHCWTPKSFCICLLVKHC